MNQQQFEEALAVMLGRLIYENNKAASSIHDAIIFAAVIVSITIVAVATLVRRQ